MPKWTLRELYDINVVATAPVSRKKMGEVLLRRVLDQCFSLRARMVSKEVPGYALVVAPGGIKFPAVKKPQPAGPPEEGIIHLSTLSQLTNALTGYYYDSKAFGVTRPVRDATGLRGFYRIPFPWAPEPGTNLLAAVSGLGLRVVSDPGGANDTRLMVLHIDHLRTNCEIGPEAAALAN